MRPQHPLPVVLAGRGSGCCVAGVAIFLHGRPESDGVGFADRAKYVDGVGRKETHAVVPAERPNLTAMVGGHHVMVVVLGCHLGVSLWPRLNSLPRILTKRMPLAGIWRRSVGHVAPFARTVAS